MFANGDKKGHVTRCLTLLFSDRICLLSLLDSLTPKTYPWEIFSNNSDRKAEILGGWSSSWAFKFTPSWALECLRVNCYIFCYILYSKFRIWKLTTHLFMTGKLEANRCNRNTSVNTLQKYFCEQNHRESAGNLLPREFSVIPVFCNRKTSVKTLQRYFCKQNNRESAGNCCPENSL